MCRSPSGYHVGMVGLASVGELVRSRRSIRAFRDEPVAPDLVASLLREAQWAPSPHNSQPWRFTALFQHSEKRRFAAAMAGQLARELRADGLAEEAVRRQTDRSQQRIDSAPVALLCSLVGDGLVTFPDERRAMLEWQMAVQSVGAVLQTLFLLAESRGLGSCWMAAPMYCPDVVRDVLGLPATYLPQALVLLGYPAGEGRVRPRRPFEEVVELR